MKGQYARRKTYEKGHEYKVFNADGVTISWIRRHRKDCARCLALNLRDEVVPPLVDLKQWATQVAPVVAESHTLVPRAYEAGEAGNFGLVGHYLRMIGTLLTEVPISPDGGRSAEYLAMAGDAYTDAEYAYSHGDNVGAGELIFYAGRCLERASVEASRYSDMAHH